MNRIEEYRLAEEAARAAGELLRAQWRGEQQVIAAEGRDIKLQADRDAENLIIERLRARSPYPLLAEESGEHGAPQDGPFWVIDPLDGTYNFKRRFPFCAVSIALVQVDMPLLGVIHDFNAGETFGGIPGEGAWLNGEPIRISGASEAGQAMLLTGLPVRRELGTESFAEMIRQFQRFKKSRMIGSAAVALAWVACGRADAYFEEEIMLWDVAAGVAINAAAGAAVELQPSEKTKWAYTVRVASDGRLWE